MIEQERKTHTIWTLKARAWAAKLAEIEHRRDKYQEMFAAETMTLIELRAKLEATKETR